jgi:alpha-glucosidase (family GH31 glycosyl hydrolase)
MNKKLREGIMYRTKITIISAMFVVISGGFAAYGDEYESIQSLVSYKQQDTAVDFVCNSARGRKVFVKIDVCTPDMLRIRSSTSEIVPREEYVVIKHDWDKTEFTVSEENEQIVIKTKSLKITAQKNPFRLAIYDREGSAVLQESPAGMTRDSQRACASMRLGADEHFFGFGAAAGIGGRTGFEGQVFNLLDKRGQEIGIVGRRVAFFMSTNGYGIFLNSIYPYNSTFRMGCERPDVFSLESNDTQLDYYFIYGPSFKDILGRYTELTGRTPLIPRWGFGTRQAGYWDQKQIEDYSRRYREKDIPCDVFHVDSSWLNKGSEYLGQGQGLEAYPKNPRGYVDFKWDDRQFPDPKAMISKLAADGFKFSVWETALVNPDVGEFYDYAAKRDYFVRDANGSICLVSYGKRGMTAVPDFSNPQAAQWWKQRHKPLVEMGVKSFKLDHTGDLGTGTNAIFHNGRNLEQMRILHRLLNLKTTFEAVKDYTKGRGMIWSSIVTAGTQRYPVTWSGDYKLTFEGLQEVVKSMQNMGLSGFGYYAPDIPAQRDIKDSHLYTRWAQFGLLNPVCQSWTVLPWQFGTQAEDSYRFYAKLHYRLLPYIYSYAWVANQTGVPVSRAMVLEYQQDPQVYDKDLQYFLGRELLVAPICTESDSRGIYLPAGKWIDYATGDKYQGPKNIMYQAPPDRIPIFVKAGAIIPVGPVMNYVGEKPTDPLTLDIYPSGTSSFTLYDDDGTSYDYEQGTFALTTFVCVEAEDGIMIDIGPARGKYKSGLDKSYILKVNNVVSPEEVRMGVNIIKRCASREEFESKTTGWWYDVSKQVTLVKLGPIVAERGERVYFKGPGPIK